MIKKRYGLIIFSIHVWFYQIHLSLLCISSSCSHFTILKFATSTKKCCLLLCNSAASVCKREKEAQQTKGKQQTTNTKNSGTQKATLTRKARIVLVVIGVLISLSRCAAAAACNKNNFLRERVESRRTQKYLMSSSLSLASSLVATGIVFGHLDARDSLDSPRFFNR